MVGGFLVNSPSIELSQYSLDLDSIGFDRNLQETFSHMHRLYACTDCSFIGCTILSDETSIIIRIRPAAVSRHWNNCDAVEPPTPVLALKTHEEIHLELNTFYPNLNCIFFISAAPWYVADLFLPFFPAIFLLFFGWRMCIQLLFLCALVCITLTATTVWAIPAIPAIRIHSSLLLLSLYATCMVIPTRERSRAKLFPLFPFSSATISTTFRLHSS